jgi:Flp pilus assembly protein TadD
LALVNLGEDTRALRALDKVLKLNPGDQEALSQRALIVEKIARAGDKKKPDPEPVQTHLRV